MIKTNTLEQIQNRIANGETCVVNLTANWCSDCTDQAKNLAPFCDALSTKQIAFYTLAVQDERNSYLSSEHEDFTASFGGHGFPRTILMIKGKAVDADNVEIISNKQLAELAEKFLKQL